MLYRVPCHNSALYYTLLFTARCCTGYRAIPQHFIPYIVVYSRMLYRVPCHTSALYTIHCCLQPDVVQGTVPFLSTLYHTLLFTARCCTRYRAIPQHFIPYIVVYSRMLYRVPCHNSALYYTLLFTARCCTGYRAIPQHFILYIVVYSQMLYRVPCHTSALYTIHCCLQPDVVQGTMPYLSTLLYIVVYSRMLYMVPCHTSAPYTIHCCLQPDVVQGTVPYLSTLYYTLLFTAGCCTGYSTIPWHLSHRSDNDRYCHPHSEWRQPGELWEEKEGVWGASTDPFTAVSSHPL